MSNLNLNILLINLLITVGGTVIFEPYSLAQIVPDQTLGVENSLVTPDDNINGVSSDHIDGGAVCGTNLFHSFQEFNIDEGRGAYFANPSGVENILSRITGNNPSNIFGKLGVLGNANLFLLNPNGIVFGANSSLNLRGSVVASTATALNFADGAKFSAAHQSSPILTVSVPIGLGFERNAGGISVRGNDQGVETPAEDFANSDFGLQVQPDRTLALVGGDIAMVGATLKTSGGRIELGSVTSPSSVGLSAVNKGWELSYEGVQQFKDIQLDRQSTVDASGIGGGDVRVLGKNITLAGGSQIDSSTLGSGLGGTLSVTGTESVELIGTDTSARKPSGIGSVVHPGATGSGGNLIVETKRLSVRDGAQIVSTTRGEGNAGSVLVKARDSIELAGQAVPIGISYSGVYSSVGSGAAGSGGSIAVETKRLDIKEGAQIFAGTSGRGKAGLVSIVAKDRVELVGTGRTPTRRRSSGIGTIALPGAIGSSGVVTIKSRGITLRDGASVSSSNLGSGKAGSVLIQVTEAIDLVGSSTDGSLASNLSAIARSSADAGDLTVDARQLNIRDGAQLSVRNDRAGRAGSLQVNADQINLDNAGNITATSASGEGGDIFLNSRSLLLQNGSTISATVGLEGGGGNGGNITIDTDTLAALNSSSITANAFTGRGGNIQITTQGLFRSPDSIFSASSQFGVNGTVDVRTFGLEPDEALVPLNQIFIPTEQVVANSCLARRNKSQNRFVITGSGGLPESPNDSVMPMPLFSDRGLEQSLPQRSQSSAPTLWQEGDPVVEATGIVETKDGRTLLGMAGSSIPDAQDAICQ